MDYYEKILYNHVYGISKKRVSAGSREQNGDYMAIGKVKEFFKGTELEGKVIELPQSSATVELAAEALHTEPDRIAKSLSFLQDEHPVLVIASGMSRVDNRKYKAQFQKKAKMIPYDRVEAYIGHAPGGVCPFAVKEEVEVWLDVSLKKHETVFPAAGSGNSAIEMTIPQMERYTGSKGWVDVCREPESGAAQGD